MKASEMQVNTQNYVVKVISLHNSTERTHKLILNPVLTKVIKAE